MRYFAIHTKVLFCLVCIAMLPLLSCEQKVEAPKIEIEENEFAFIERTWEPFKQPENFNIDYKTALYFGRASEALVFMGQEWAEKMSQANDEEKLKMAASYEMAQDSLIRKFGIRGKEEFRWIQTRALPAPENAEILAKVGIWVSR